MVNNATILFKDVKNFLSSEVNRVFISVVIVGLISVYNCYRTEVLINELKEQIKTNQTELLASDKKIIDKVHFRYFNTTKSLEEIHNIKINTKNGKLEK